MTKHSWEMFVEDIALYESECRECQSKTVQARITKFSPSATQKTLV